MSNAKDEKKEVAANFGITESPTRFMDIPTSCAKCKDAPDFLEILKLLNPWTYQLNARCHGQVESLVWEMNKHDPKQPLIFFSK